MEAAAATPPAKPSRAAVWRREIIGILWLILAVLGFHSFIAKPFYIPSESMLPGLLVGDQLVVTKYPYGWSFISPTIPNPVAIWKDVVLRQPQESWGVQLPFVRGRLFGRVPERGDVVIVTPPGRNTDYIKRVIGLPGDRIEVRDGVVLINNVAVKRGPLHYVDVPDYGGMPLPNPQDGTTCDIPGGIIKVGGQTVCRLPLVRESLPNGRSYETVDLSGTGFYAGDNFAPVTIPPDHVFLMGDNRERSADSRVPLDQGGLGGPVPFEYIGGRAEFITFSKNGHATWNPLTWWSGLRGGRAGTSLHPTRGQ
ncbi:signal peptidase I [Sphingomonas sp.]|uniref:signal peptidase I n=1 Tax=Sphingomonas sp. TaxID=28214 RepID=UPI0025F285C8|nr:signal peptidase I [Sphingomonas sp.]